MIFCKWCDYLYDPEEEIHDCGGKVYDPTGIQEGMDAIDK